MRIDLTTPTVTASIASRTISGRIVTFGEVGNTSAGPTRFDAGSIHVPSVVRLNLEHDRTRPIGVASAIGSSADGIGASFKIIGTRAGDDALIEAAEGLRAGFSVGVDVSDFTYDGDVLVVQASELDHVALTTDPAIRSAVVTDVAAQHTVLPGYTGATPETPDPEPSEPVEAPEPEENPVVETTPAAVVEATAPVEPVRVAAAIVTAEAFPYTPTDTRLSLFRDMYNSRHDVEAAARSRKATAMLVDAAMTSVIPPGYRPDLYQGELLQGMPVANACTHIPISDATAFTVPTFASATALVADNVTATNPASGTIATSSVSVTPKAVSGIWDAPRELLDASNPGLDQIAITAMLEEYSRDLEADVVTAVLAGATAGTAGPTTKYTSSLIKNLAAFPFARFLPADQALAGPTLFQELAGEEDTAGRAKNPYYNPTNSVGQLGAAAATLNVTGMPVVGAWSLPVQQGLILRKSDAAVFESGPQMFRWEEVGPSIVRFAIWGYVGAAVLRAVGVVKYTQTA